jgi:hypothetical protein
MNLITEVEIIKNLLKTSKLKDLKMFRLKFMEKRLYATTKPFEVFSGLTGSLDACKFKGDIESKRIGKWRDKTIATFGSQEAQEGFLGMMADFGNLTHSALVTIKETGGLNWADEQQYAKEFFEASAKKNGFTPNQNIIQSQVFEYCKAAAAILQFCYDNVVEIYGIEAMAKSDDLMIATPIDLVAKVKSKDGDIMVSINLKTSSQIGNHHREQVSVEKYLWNNTYPDCQVVKTGIVRTKEWNTKKVPTYEYELLKPEDESRFLNSALGRLAICKDDPQSSYLNYQKDVQVFVGQTKLGELPNIEVKTLEQLFNDSQVIPASPTTEDVNEFVEKVL